MFRAADRTSGIVRSTIFALGARGAILLVIGLLGGQLIRAQDGAPKSQDDVAAERKRVFDLVEQHKFNEAIPILEKFLAANASDVKVLEELALAYLESAVVQKDPAIRKAALARAHSLALRAKELGDNSTRLGLILQAPTDITEAPVDTNTDPAVREINAAMQKAEAAFSTGDFEQAVVGYQQTLKLDPKNYEAALYMGDAYFKLKKIDEACAAYARAIAINPDRETAYRYWSDVLLKTGKFDEARDKAITAIIAEPYARNVWNGLVQWANNRKVALAKPDIKQPPSSMSAKSDSNSNNVTITVDPGALESGKTNPWFVYDMIRATYKTTGFAKDHPDEKTYRHSLAEEVTALRAVTEVVSAEIKKGQTAGIDTSLMNLAKLNDAGLLEAYVLLSRADQGIAMDYPAYRAANREKLRRYITEVIIAGGVVPAAATPHP